MRRIIIVTGIIFIYAFAASAQAPQVVQVTPAQNEVAAAVTANITATFDIDMDPATIDNSTFSVYSRTYGYLAGTVSYDQPTSTATFSPARDFFYGDVITAILTSGIGSLGGTPMDRGFSWTFTIVAIGGGGFGDFAEYPVRGSFGHYAVTVSDLNMDDYPDIIAGQISVFLNNGDGTFPSRDDYPQVSEIWSICAADFNRDGYNDIAALMAGAYNNRLLIMMNNGDGSFGTPENFDLGDELRGICAVDIENDSDLDIVFGGEDTLNNSNVFVFTNDGTGNFTLDASYPIAHYIREVYCGDFNNDGAPDIAVTRDGINIFYNDGYGVFLAPVFLPFFSSSYGIAAGDLNSDGLLDLAASTFANQTLWIVINEGNGNFNPLYNYPTDNQLFNLSFADLNGDQSLDVSMVSLKYDSDINTYRFYNNGDGSMALNSSLNVANSSLCYDIVASDLDLDGDIDIVDYTSSAQSITVMKNLPACGYVTGDVNGSGDYNGLDVVYAVNYFKGGNSPVYDECDCPVGGFWYVAGDVNASCDFNGLDITYGVSYLKGGSTPSPCPDCPPAQ